MGYIAYIVAQDFSIEAENLKPMAEALVMASNNAKPVPNTGEVKRDLAAQLLVDWGFKVQFGRKGGITEIWREGGGSYDKANYEKLWVLIAPFVKGGSYIECADGYGTRWRNTFDGGLHTEKHQEVRWVSEK